jgi:transposase
LKRVFEENCNDKLIYCSGNNRIGIDLYLKENWKTIGINQPPRFSWTLDGYKVGLTNKDDKGKMFEKLVDETEGIIYFTHLDDEKNTWGYVIRKRCEKYNKKYIEVLLDEDNVYSKEGLNEMVISIMEVNNFLLKPSNNFQPK